MDISLMRKNIVASSDISLENLKKSMLPILNAQRFKNDEERKKEFEGFTDAMILAHYLLRDTHFNVKREKAKRTLKTYQSVLTTFYNDCFQYAVEIGLDLSKLPADVNGNVSLYKGLTRMDIERYCDWFINRSPFVLNKRNYAISSISQKLVIIKGFLKKLYEWDYIDFPLHTAFKSLTLTKHDKPYRDMGPDQVTFLLDLFREEKNVLMFTFIHVLTTTGIRNNELCELRVGDVRYDNINGMYYLHVVAKGNKDREIPLKEKTLEVIRYFRKVRGAKPFEEAARINPNEPLFMTSRGNAYSPSYLNQVFKKELSNLPMEKKQQLEEKFTYYAERVPGDKKSGIVHKVMDITPHAFRHAFAIISMKSGIDIDTIQMSLGHADRKTTEIYLESVIKKEQHAIHRWDKQLMRGYL